MEVVLAATITGLFAVVGALITVRRPMRKEHGETKRTLEYISGQVDTIAGQTSDTEHKIDEHIADHARHEFD